MPINTAALSKLLGRLSTLQAVPCYGSRSFKSFSPHECPTAALVMHEGGKDLPRFTARWNPDPTAFAFIAGTSVWLTSGFAGLCRNLPDLCTTRRAFALGPN